MYHFSTEENGGIGQYKVLFSSWYHIVSLYVSSYCGCRERVVSLYRRIMVKGCAAMSYRRHVTISKVVFNKKKKIDFR